MKKFDIYGDQVKLNYNSNYKIKTTIGGYLTFFSLFLILYYFYQEESDIFYKKQPKVFQENKMSRQSNNITLDKNNFRLYFNVLDSNRRQIDLTNYFVLELRTRTRNSLKNKFNVNKIDFEKCKMNHLKDDPIFNDSNEFKETYILEKQYYCLKSMNYSHNIYGVWLEKEMEFLQISLFKCEDYFKLYINETKENTKCKSNSEVLKLIEDNKLLLSIYYTKNHLDLTDYEKPIQKYLKEDYYYLPYKNEYRFFSYFLNNIYVSTDYGYFFESISTSNFVNMVFNYSDEAKDNGKTGIISIDIISGNEITEYRRSYSKILSILSDTGGVIQILSLIFFLICSLFYKVERSKMMINNFFTYKDVNKEKTTHQIKLYYLNKIFKTDNIGDFDIDKNDIDYNNVLISKLKAKIKTVNSSLDIKNIGSDLISNNEKRKNIPCNDIDNNDNSININNALTFDKNKNFNNNILEINAQKANINELNTRNFYNKFNNFEKNLYQVNNEVNDTNKYDEPSINQSNNSSSRKEFIKKNNSLIELRNDFIIEKLSQKNSSNDERDKNDNNKCGKIENQNQADEKKNIIYDKNKITREEINTKNTSFHSYNKKSKEDLSLHIEINNSKKFETFNNEDINKKELCNKKNDILNNENLKIKNSVNEDRKIEIKKNSKKNIKEIKNTNFVNNPITEKNSQLCIDNPHISDDMNNNMFLKMNLIKFHNNSICKKYFIPTLDENEHNFGDDLLDKTKINNIKSFKKKKKIF